MCKLVNGLTSSTGGQVPHAKCQMVEIKPSVFPLRKPEDKAERTAGRRKVDLDAAGETGSIPCFLVAGKEGVDGLALAF